MFPRTLELRGNNLNLNKIAGPVNADKIMYSSFDFARIESEYKALSDLGGQWCVCMKYGTFKAFPLRYALEHDYHIVSVTIY